MLVFDLVQECDVEFGLLTFYFLFSFTFKLNVCMCTECVLYLCVMLSSVYSSLFFPESSHLYEHHFESK